MRVPGIDYIQAKNAYADLDRQHYGIAIHNTSNTASARAEARYAQVRTDGVSTHFVVDGLEVIQLLDTGSKAGHAGSSTGNENSIAVEIVGTNDRDRSWWLNNVHWDSTPGWPGLGQVLAAVIRSDLPGFQVRRASIGEMKSTPRVSAFYSHDDMRLAWGGTTHTDPGSNFPWDKLFASVNMWLTGAPITMVQEDGMHCVHTPGGSIWYFPGTVDNLGKPYVYGPPYPAVSALQRGMPTIEAPGELDLGAFHQLVWGVDSPNPPASTVSVDDLVKALTDPRVRPVLVDTSFEGAQQAETK